MAKSKKPTWVVDTRTGTGVLAPYAERIVSSLHSVPQRGLKAYYAAGKAILAAGQRTPFGESMVVRTLASSKLTGSCVNTLTMCRDLARYWNATEVRNAAATGMSRRAASALLPLNLYACQKGKYDLKKRQARQLRSATSRFIADWPQDGSKDDVCSWYKKVAAWKGKHQPLLGNPRSQRKLRGAVQRLETVEKVMKDAAGEAEALLEPERREAASKALGRAVKGAAKLQRLLQAEIDTHKK